MYFDNIILHGYNGRHVTSNRFRFLAAFEKGPRASFANNLLKVFLSRHIAAFEPLCATV